MARRARKAKSTNGRTARRRPLRRVLRWGLRGVASVAGLWLALVVLFAFVNPPVNVYQWQESRRLGGISQDWVAWDDIAPVMGRAAVAAEDANFCLHWGFDMGAIRAALDAGGARGASTISQQVVKNVFLWHGRSWVRKALEAGMTPVVELLWSKRRILEVYLNVAEFDAGVFGVQAAAQHYFGRDAASLTAQQAARLAAALPDPKGRNPARPSAFLQRRAASITSGAETILADGRAACFEG
ncbi:MAG TPA: monofunctional biosynthetic peptidoglycan transglycosylase [Paracoccaceae bacterium]|nr:monofunctional biosynthetic peptidoglycan transglycosylase [Paracoccaceae bacterium]HMO71969.1 monofunctional biosynthetic peptidoglycan transglycosylase [Paracoccaceae bacterium]